jgi:hypothetical protein
MKGIEKENRREEVRKVFENMVLKRIFGPKRK